MPIKNLLNNYLERNKIIFAALLSKRTQQNVALKGKLEVKTWQQLQKKQSLHLKQ